MLNIVRGDLKNKPITSERLASFFETKNNELEGTLYIGYPIIRTANGGFQIDSLLVTKEYGLIAFHLEEGTDTNINYQDIQDEYYTKIQSKLIQYKELTKKRDLAIDINIISFVPAWTDIPNIDKDYPCFNNEENLDDYLKTLQWTNSDYYEKLLSVLQSITTIRKTKSRQYVKKADSKGAKLKKLEESIANLDRQQSSAVIETVEGVQRIRGLAGSGKTIILALKVAYLHAKNPNWKIAVTFNTRSLKEQFKKLIRMFTYEHINEEPDWKNIDIIHAWGAPSYEGIYFNLCKEHNIEYFDFKSAKRLTSAYGKEFDKVCEKALSEIKSYTTKYDMIVVDEAQDFSSDFLKICFNILKEPKRLIYAYDELQSLNKKSMESPEKIFGVKENGEPLVKLENLPNKPKQDIVLYKCYRNSKEILTTAHALGFGIYYKETDLPAIQMFENSELWKDIGYSVVEGDLVDGQRVKLTRTNESSPEFLSHSPVDDLIQFHAFKNNLEQVEYVVNEIEKNIREDELTYDDIIVINTNPLETQKIVGLFRQKLFEKHINSNLAGVSTSPDIFHTSDAITFTGIYRAKGNESAIVYIINAQYCYSGYELSKKRNILFTAMTRAKAWVRVCGYGDDMEKLSLEYQEVKNQNFTLNFKYPTEEERKKMNILNRDMTAEEKQKVQKSERSLKDILEDLKTGKVRKEDLPSDIIDELKQLLF